MTLLRHWLLHLDGFNRLAPGAFKEDNDDIWWSNVKYSPKESTPPSASSDFKQTAFPIIDGVGNSEPSTTPNANLIRQADLENHNKDGGLWIVVEGKVYDVQDSPNGADTPREMLPHFYVGNYFNPPPPDAENQENIATGAIADNQVDSMADKGDAGYHGLLDASNFSSPLVDLERHLAYFLGLFNHSQYLGMPPVTEEVNCSAWTKQVGPLHLFFSPFPYESLLKHYL